MEIKALESEHIRPLAQALYRQWHDFAPWSSVDKICRYYESCLKGTDLPIAFAAEEQGCLAGSAALKRHDVAMFPEYEYWLGDVFVMPEYRGRGIGRQLVSHCLTVARQMGLPGLYLYTPDVQAVYEKMGWREIGTCFYNGETVSIMYREIGTE